MQCELEVLYCQKCKKETQHIYNKSGYQNKRYHSAYYKCLVCDKKIEL